MNNISKWYNDYIYGINIKDINWIKLNSNELDKFIENNYLDKEIWKYVTDENNLYPTLLGMNFLNIYSPLYNKEHYFVLGVVDNNIGKKTVVASTEYLDEYYMFTNQEQPLTYIYNMEVNVYFRNRGIFKEMCEEIINYINLNQHIITTKQTEIGAKYKVFNIFKEILLANEFNNFIYEDNKGIINSELYNIICPKTKRLTNGIDNK